MQNACDLGSRCSLACDATACVTDAKSLAATDSKIFPGFVGQCCSCQVRVDRHRLICNFWSICMPVGEVRAAARCQNRSPQCRVGFRAQRFERIWGCDSNRAISNRCETMAIRIAVPNRKRRFETSKSVVIAVKATDTHTH